MPVCLGARAWSQQFWLCEQKEHQGDHRAPRQVPQLKWRHWGSRGHKMPSNPRAVSHSIFEQVSTGLEAVTNIQPWMVIVTVLDNAWHLPMGPKTREGPPFNELIEPKLERWRKILRKLWGKPKQDAGSHHHLCTTPTIPMRLMHWGEIGTWSFSLWRSIHQRCLFLSHSVSSLIAYCEPSHQILR